MKTCSKCLVSLPLESFALFGGERARSARTPQTARKAWCKACFRVHYRGSAGRKNSLRVHNLKRKAGGDLTVRDLARLDPATCYLCGDAITDDGEIDHIVPASRGGETTLSNLAWTHRLCNRVKHDLPLDALRQHLLKMLAQDW